MLEKLELDDEGKGLHLCSVLFAYFILFMLFQMQVYGLYIQFSYVLVFVGCCVFV